MMRLCIRLCQKILFDESSAQNNRHALQPPNQPLQLTAGPAVFINVYGIATGFGLSDGFRQTPTAPELESLGRNAFL